MKILSNTLDVEVETWSDPGDYPNSAAGEPLPSYDYVSDVIGEVRVELSTLEVVEFLEADCCGEVQDWASKLDISLPSGILTVNWNVQLIDQLAVLTVTDFEADPYSDNDDQGDQ